jgi:hypothetical protein
MISMWLNRQHELSRVVSGPAIPVHRPGAYEWKSQGPFESLQRHEEVLRAKKAPITPRSMLCIPKTPVFVRMLQEVVRGSRVTLRVHSS